MLNISLPNRTYITADWVSLPDTNIRTTKGRQIGFPSAFMAVRVPYNIRDGFAQNAAFFACSVDARWARGNNVGTGLTGDTDIMMQYGNIDRIRKPTPGLGSDIQESFLPIEGPDWRTVSIDDDWLSTLTPRISKGSDTWSTLASAFTDAGFDNSTGIVNQWTSLGTTIENTIATIVVDGMSRVGLSDNGGNMYQVMNRYDWINWDGDRSENWNRMLRGEDVIQPPSGTDAANITRLEWTVTVSGLAYKADGLPYYLALSVLILHTLLATLHIIHMLWTRQSSDTWHSFEEMILLSQNSRPRQAGKLSNTCGGTSLIITCS
jgi:hypothetical protein